jgi:hypothetical protein
MQRGALRGNRGASQIHRSLWRGEIITGEHAQAEAPGPRDRVIRGRDDLSTPAGESNDASGFMSNCVI